MIPPAPVRLGVLGCGWIAGNRLRQIAGREPVEIVAVADTDPKALATIAALAPDAGILPDIDAFDPGHVDAVMISTPSALHRTQALTLIERGLPVFVQKPIGVCAAEVGEVLAAAARADVPVETDLCYRHLASAVALREALDAASIGEPFLVEGCFHNAYRPGAGWSHDVALCGGGALMDLGIHLLDLITWLTAKPLSLKQSCLRCRGRFWRDGEVEDFAALDLELDGGVPVRLTTCWDASTGQDAEIRLRIYGERGNLELSNRRGSFFDFHGRRCYGTWIETLATDEGDQWQAGPLCHWLRQVRSGAAYREPMWLDQTMSIIDDAYGLARTRRTEPTAARGTVHVLGKKGVVP